MPRAHAPKVGTDRRIGLVLPTQTTATAMPRAPKVGTDRRIGPVLPTPITATEISHARARLGAYETSHRNCDRNSGACEGRRPINVDARARLCAREISRRNNGAREGRPPVKADAHARLCACETSLQNYKSAWRCRSFSSVCTYVDYVDHAAEPRTQRAAGTRRSRDGIIQDASTIRARMASFKTPSQVRARRASFKTPPHVSAKLASFMTPREQSHG